MRIGEPARRTGVSERSLRCYEAQGLVAAGLHSGRVGQVPPCMRDADGGPSAAATPMLVAHLAAERERSDRTVADLRRSRETPDEVIDAARGR
ncbi:MerR family transcriptional regulator [Streptomyces pseudovenezuelae]|uniref:HTH merR-type domain-containing protein n=1 Tax=Streptomyces pseudovenezuelae TaxID=67350 RepID=A0ABT6LWD9_9ACTN|nr:MerR family transcriptional regulator [Streptomyces pseudovenezuelae]MDH6220628.1 hypothetical protein [Streptomyces pseudovenezuelae]